MKTPEGKVVALGFQGVGKTSIICRYINKTLSERSHPTIGACYHTCYLTVENTRIVLKVWDTAGQEKFRSMAPMYYRSANAAMLVFDLTQYDTFTAMKEWVTELHKHVENSIVLVVIGNKSDLEEKRQVDAAEGRAYATEIGAGYHETSVVQNEGIEDVFLDIAKGLVRLLPTECDQDLDAYGETPRNVDVVHELCETSERSRKCC
ncbi:uncharacterized protein LOC117227706 [Megalopta genalis]|uniref:uncharacterized protein LOC117227706 n=1 Tax=Megalopta genalis TaxID=115081 RepID=UPI0014430774|nr:ras-related protein RHN1-like [Megalopta genalis]